MFIQVSPWLLQVTTLGLVYPSLLLIYFGEAAYLGTFPSTFARSYFAAIPQPLFWPMFVVATASALVGSQSLITSAFSVARQSAVMSCFPPVRVSFPLHLLISHSLATTIPFLCCSNA